MKTLFTFCISLLTVVAVAQSPTNLGSDGEDGITYQTYNLIDHGVVSSVRFMAQNTTADDSTTWEFFTGNYSDNWRPYTAHQSTIGFDLIIDPSIEASSARYNSGFGGQIGRLPYVQAGLYYTFVVENVVAVDAKMSILETDFSPVAIDTIYNNPTNPVEGEGIVFNLELDGATSLSPGEHVFIRWSTDDFATSNFTELTVFNAGVAQFYTPGVIPAGTTVKYYGLVTEEAVPDAETIDYHTLFFGNNDGNNYEFTVSAVTGIEASVSEYGVIQTVGTIAVNNAQGLTNVELIAVDGKVVASEVVQGTSVYLSTSGLPSGLYILNMIGKTTNTSAKLFVQ